MKLSLAIMLGSTTCKMEPCDWNSCAIGSAGNAIGVPQGVENFGIDRSDKLFTAWPWIAGDLYWLGIADRFDNQVCEGKMTLEELVDYVKSIEPSCGECCRFTCTCAKFEAVPESVEAVCQL